MPEFKFVGWVNGNLTHVPKKAKNPDGSNFVGDIYFCREINQYVDIQWLQSDVGIQWLKLL